MKTMHAFRTLRRVGVPILALLGGLGCDDENGAHPVRSVTQPICDDGNDCTTDHLSGFKCRHNPKSAGTRCTYTATCTGAGTCNSTGTCIATNLCSDGNPCTIDSCVNQGRLGYVCEHTAGNDGASCNDNNACTASDYCSNGSCTGNPLYCNDGNACTSDSCDPARGCVYTPKPNGTSCNDDNACTTGDRCQGGACKGKPISCNDHNPCTNDACAPTIGCIYSNVADGTSCNDKNACTGSDHCNAGSCGGIPLFCNDSNSCTADSCDPAKGCVFTPKPGQSCNDNNACTTADRCQTDGSCAGSPIVCDDGNACTWNLCSPSAGCYFLAYHATACDDGLPCTIDSCDPAVGCRSIPKDCSDANPCTKVSCRASDGQCMHTPANGQSCDDLNSCTLDDQCNAHGQCSGQAKKCPKYPCRSGECNAASGECEYSFHWAGTACDDGDSNGAVGICDGQGICATLPASASVAPSDSPIVDARWMGHGRHPIAASHTRIGLTFIELLHGGSTRLGLGLYSSAGSPIGWWYKDDVLLEPDPVVAALPDGSFALAFTDVAVDGDLQGVALVRVDRDGQQVGKVVAANHTTAFSQHSPDIMWDGSQLWVAWEDESESAKGGRCVCRRSFSMTLTPLAAEDQCDSGEGDLSGAVLANTSHGIARAWRREIGGTGTIDVRYAGNAWSLALNGLPARHEKPTLVELDANHLLVVYTDGDGVQVQAVLTPSGEAGSTVLNAGMAVRYEPAAAVTAAGVYLAWREPPALVSDPSGWDPLYDELYLQHGSWDGAALSWGEIIRLPHDLAYCEGDQTTPALASTRLFPTGGVAAAWNDLLGSTGNPKHGDVRMSLMPTPIVRSEGGE